VTGGHVMGVPLEEGALALAPAGAVMAAGAALVVRDRLARIRARLRRLRGHAG
jgi:hypothetical protein